MPLKTANPVTVVPQQGADTFEILGFEANASPTETLPSGLAPGSVRVFYRFGLALPGGIVAWDKQTLSFSFPAVAIAPPLYSSVKAALYARAQAQGLMPQGLVS